MGSTAKNMRWLAIGAMGALMAACASMGRPEGGPRDLTPPRYLGSNPAPGAINHTRPKIEITFDENIKIDNPMDRVVISPAQRTPAAVTASGRKVIVELRDSLLDNTTYTIDFSDAIRDLNEGNILDGFATDFSTGPYRDSLQISGMVFQARNLEPAQGMLVGVYSNLADSAISTLQMERIAKTNQLGEFTIRNLKPGEYRIFAVKDQNRDYHWDRSEDVAFYDLTITPGHQPTVVNDTLIALDGSDSIVSRKATLFTPNDILLTWFNEDYKSIYLKDHLRPDSNRISLRMSAPVDSLPTLTIVNGPNAGRTADSWALLDTRPERDSLEYWITDPAVISQDSLMLSVRYIHTDKSDSITWTNDTIKFFFKRPKPKKEKKKSGTDSITAPEIKYLDLRGGNPTHEANKPLQLTVGQPLATIDTLGINLAIKRDTTWYPLPRPKIKRDSTSLLKYTLSVDWEPGSVYRLTVDSAAMVGIYGVHNKPLKSEFTVKPLEEYSNITFKVNGLQNDSTPTIVELLNSSDGVIATAPVVNGVATFNFVNPATVYARAFFDKNGNGVWDTGRLNDKIQPEEVYYYPQRIKARRNWDIEQTWDIFALPVDRQKPLDIKKNKPVTKESDRNRNNRSDDEDDDFYEGYDGVGTQYDNYHNNSIGNSRRPGGNLRKNNRTDFAH